MEIFNTQGQSLKKVVLAFTEETSFSIEDFYLKEDDSIACICKIWRSEETGNNTTSSYLYACFDRHGKERSKVFLELSTSENAFDFIIKEDTIYLLTNQELFLFNEMGILLEQYKSKKEKAIHFMIDSTGNINIISYSVSQKNYN